MRLSSEAVQILHALRQGALLKAHRTLDGAKIHKVHPLNGEPSAVSAGAAQALIERGWVRSNLKFPVATYLLTETGRQLQLVRPSGRLPWQVGCFLNALYQRLRHAYYL